MKANELRIGNWVEQPNDGVTRVTAILNDLQIKTETGYVDKYCRPIPLTEEWLLKFGFEKTLKSTNTFTLFNHEEGEVWFEICGADGYEWYRPHDIFPRIKSIHQLQNLYFALTGEELTLKEKQDA